MDDTSSKKSSSQGRDVTDVAMRELIDSLSRTEPTAPSWCPGWSAHEITAHVTGAATERADLITEHLAGATPRPTRSWEEREPPLRALPDETLRERLYAEAARFESVAAEMEEASTIEYTGWSMTRSSLRNHSHSEAALHRWDLVGDDQVSKRLLADPALTRHALAVFSAIPALPEARRWVDVPLTSAPVRFRVPDEPDVLVTPGKGLAMVTPDGDDPAIDLSGEERLLVLWGRCPARLKHPEHPAENIDDILERLLSPGARFRRPAPDD